MPLLPAIGHTLTHYAEMFVWGIGGVIGVLALIGLLHLLGYVKD